MTQVYAQMKWYRARPEPEKLWRGVLRERPAPVGPATRAALKYTFLTQHSQFAVYAAHMEKQLAPFVGRRVLVCGKLVDLSREGYGQELWIGSIRAMESEPRQ